MKRYRGESPAFTKHLRSPWSNYWRLAPDKKSGKRLKARKQEALAELERKHPEYLAEYEAYSVPSKRFVRRYRRKGYHVSTITVMNLLDHFIMGLSVAEEAR